MPTRISPEVRRRRLAAELRRLRERSGLTGDEVARQLGWSPSKVSRYELARTGLKPADVRALLEVYGVDAARRDELLALARQATSKGWWDELSDIMTEEYISIIGLEEEASAEWAWHLDVVPGLLQTEDYARAINNRGYSLAPVPPSHIERSIQTRMRRQEILTREPPLELSVVLDESVLRRRFGGPEVMRGQLEHLLVLAQRPNISVRVVRFADETPIAMNSFDLLRFGPADAATMPDVVWTEHVTTALYFEGEADTFQFRIVFERLEQGALSGPESLRYISELAESTWA
jgi:transcriptional regulator with XRE-family HTH domain